jgi:cytochrome P450
MDGHTASILVALLAAIPVVYILRAAVHQIWFRPFPGIPMTKPSFPLGHLNPKDIFNFITPMIQQKEKVGSVFQMFILRQPLIVVQNLVDAEAILNRDDFEQSNTASEVFGYFLPNSLIALQGEGWREHRRIMGSMVRTSQLRELSKIMVRKTKVLLARWEREFADKNVEMDAIPEATNFALDIIIEAASGVECNTLDAKAGELDATKELREAIDVLFGGFFERFTVPRFFWPIWYYVLNYRKYTRSFTVLDRWIFEKAATAKATGEGDFFIAQLANGNEEGGVRPLEPMEIRDEICFAIFAGHETSANTMMWALTKLGQHLDVQEKARKEILSVIGPSRDPTFDDVHHEKMPYLDCVLKEVQRVACVVPQIQRRALHNVVLPSGFTIPKDGDVMIASFGLSQDPEYWKDPTSFLPERWAGVNAESKMEYIPFGAGHRACVGKRMALLEIKLMLSTIIRAFTLRTAPDNDCSLTTASTFRIKEARIKVERNKL